MAANAAYSVLQDTTLNAPVATLLLNANDPAGDPLTATLASQAQNGTVTVNADGSFAYVPNAGFIGMDSFTFTVSDGVLTSSSATATVVVKGSNAPAWAPTIFWTGLGGDDSWDNPLNWTGNQVPTAADDVEILGQVAGNTVVIDSGSGTAAVAHNLYTSAHLQILGSLTITGTGNIAAGLTLAGGDLEVAAGGTVIVDGGGALTGTVNVGVNGSLNFSTGAYWFTNLVVGGAITVEAGVSLNFTAGQSILLDGTAFTGDGLLCVAGADLQVEGTVSAQNVQLLSGDIGGSGTFIVTEDMDWRGGSMQDSGTTSISSGATLTIDGLSPTYILEGGRTLDNSGNSLWMNGALVLDSAARWLNETGAVLDLQAGVQVLSMDSTGAVWNSGTILQSGGAGQTNFDVPLHTTGTVSIQAGTLALAAGGDGSGQFLVGAGAMLNFLGGTFTTQAGAVFDGLGAVALGAVAQVPRGHRLRLRGLMPSSPTLPH